ncbi:MAG TPA: dienelactone hydrolase family protein [Bryobacteraceae bacterium]|nr:dienelactone hydrolase family protein [Bryobacteraceae bacterium]
MGRITLLAALCASALTAQDWARQAVDKSPRHREWVTVKHDGRSVETFIAYPERRDKAPVVLVIHEIFGMSDWVEELADEFAAAGYVAVAPDLLSGMAPGGGRTKDFAAGRVGEAIGKLPPDQINADLNAAADYGLKLPASNGRLFVAGFCWGGGQSFRFATTRPDLKAAFVFYGPPPAKESIANIKAPVYGFYAGMDARIGQTIPDTVSQMKAAGKSYDPVTYDGAGHGFMRSGEQPDATDPNKKARAEAWARLNALIKKNS